MNKFVFLLILSLRFFSAQTSYAQFDEEALKNKTQTTVCDELKKNSRSTGSCSITNWEYTTYTVSFSLAGNPTDKIKKFSGTTEKKWDSVTSSYNFKGIITCNLTADTGWSCVAGVSPFVVTIQSKACYCSTGDIISPLASCVGPSYCAKNPTISNEDGLRYFNFPNLAQDFPRVTDGFLITRPH